MKTELLTGPVEWGVRLTLEEGDGLAWDVMVDSLERQQAKWEAVRASEILTIIGGWGGWWHCSVCGNPQLGPYPFQDSPDRCLSCGPEGKVPCPATHTEKPCPLCRGNGYVEEL